MRYVLAVAILFSTVAETGARPAAIGEIHDRSSEIAAETDQYWSPRNRIAPPSGSAPGVQQRPIGTMTPEALREEQEQKARIAAGARAIREEENASEFPVVDIEAACEKMAPSILNQDRDRNVNLNFCLTDNQRYYNVARFLWVRVSPRRRVECIYHANNFDKKEFYRTLGSCIEAKLSVEMNEREMEQLRGSPQRFRY